MKTLNLIPNKANIAKLFTVGLLAAGVALATPHRAEAQVSFGVRVGGPVYARPVYGPPARFYAPPAYGYGYGYYHRPYAGYYGHPYYDRFHHGYWR